MKAIYVTKRFRFFTNKYILCLGIFDGLHIGHQYIIEKALRQAKRRNLAVAVLTFKPHPANVLKRKDSIKMLQTFNQRLAWLERLGVDYCFVIRFNKRFSALKAEEFAQNFLVRTIRPETIIVGCDFRFGKDSAGDVGLLDRLSRRFGFKLKIISSRKIREEKISSSLIRRLLAAGKIKQANALLGRPYSLEGMVVAGARRGRKIGFPTLNINYDPEVILPLGVFSGFVNIDTRIYRAAIFIGFGPTFSAKTKKANLEVHILNFKKNIYGKKVEVFLVSKIRNQKKFKTSEELKLAIKKDIKIVKKVKISSLTALLI